MSPHELLRAHDIEAPRNFGPGRDYRTVCPKCSARRTKARDPCLSIKVEHGVLYALCWHCGWKLQDDGAERDQQAGPRNPRGTRPGHRASRQAFSQKLRASWR